MSGERLPWVWDYDLDAETFSDLLAGRKTIGRLERDWPAVRLLEYAPYAEIVRWLGFPALIRQRCHCGRARQGCGNLPG